MDQQYREPFNRAYTEELYHDYSRRLCERLNTQFEFRLAETPVFLPKDLISQLESASEEIVDQLCDETRLQKMRQAIPSRWDTPGMDKLPNFAQVDFAIVEDANGKLTPRLIELQGFPSLTAFQTIQRDAWAETMAPIPGLDRDWSCWFRGYDRHSFADLARRTILGTHKPDDVILMDIDPRTQKTWPDFASTKLLFDVDAVCPTKLVKKGKTLWRERNGELVQIKRIYNRVVFDELERKNLEIPFDYREELEVEWTPHPNWYWVWSKYSLPFLDHWSVPRATFVSDLSSIPSDLGERYVLKPLFSFAGGGVNVEPTAEDVEKIPDAEKHIWCIQEKIEYAPAIKAADGGGVKVEVRMMFFRPDDEPKPLLAQNLCRLSRGKMLGVDFNKNFTWVGSSVGLH